MTTKNIKNKFGIYLSIASFLLLLSGCTYNQAGKMEINNKESETAPAGQVIDVGVESGNQVIVVPPEDDSIAPETDSSDEVQVTELTIIQ